MGRCFHFHSVISVVLDSAYFLCVTQTSLQTMGLGSYCSNGKVILHICRLCVYIHIISIIAVMVQLYFTHLTFFDYAFTYIFLILGYVLFRLVLFLIWYCLVICSKFYDRLCYYVGYEFFMEVLKIGLNC